MFRNNNFIRRLFTDLRCTKLATVFSTIRTFATYSLFLNVSNFWLKAILQSYIVECTDGPTFFESGSIQWYQVIQKGKKCMCTSVYVYDSKVLNNKA